MSGAGLRTKVAAEFLGTFVFVLVGVGSAVATSALGITDSAASLLIAALANGLGLAMAVSATMAVSGGSLNPAVTLCLFVARKLQAREVLPYVIAELAGAILAGLALTASFPAAFGNAAHWGAPTLAGSVTVAQGTLIELIMTFVLVFAIFGTAVDSRAPKIGGLGIGLAVLVDVLTGGPFTGAAMNPARAMGPMIAGLFLPGYWYIYWVGPIAGAILAALAYRYAVEGKGWTSAA
ncbi:MAG: aquaporin [Nitrososphaerales archaeon]|nr:aquaporin [Nitrososphaerales archaeon]